MKYLFLVITFICLVGVAFNPNPTGAGFYFIGMVSLVAFALFNRA